MFRCLEGDIEKEPSAFRRQQPGFAGTRRFHRRRNMAGNQLSMNYAEVQQAISISEDVKKEVCELYLNVPFGFERSQEKVEEVTSVINTMFDILCKGNAKLNVSLDQGSRDVKDTDEEERSKYSGGSADPGGGGTSPRGGGSSGGGNSDSGSRSARRKIPA